jgi:HPt (histidine-containing phosphotransfer) domain-containing protein
MEHSGQDLKHLPGDSPINWQLMEERCLDAESLKQILPVFIESNAQNISIMKTAWGSKDQEALRGIAHTMKGSAANIGAEAISRAALLLEQGCRNGTLDDADELIQQIEQLHKELEIYISNLA